CCRAFVRGRRISPFPIGGSCLGIPVASIVLRDRRRTTTRNARPCAATRTGHRFHAVANPALRTTIIVLALKHLRATVLVLDDGLAAIAGLRHTSAAHIRARSAHDHTLELARTVRVLLTARRAGRTGSAHLLLREIRTLAGRR